MKLRFCCNNHFFLKFQGNCANFVETEQLVEYLSDKLSFVQIRGSIPLFWSQTPDCRYKPAINIDLSKEHLSAAHKHAESLLKTYGRHIYINLVRFVYAFFSILKYESY